MQCPDSAHSKPISVADTVAVVPTSNVSALPTRISFYAATMLGYTQVHNALMALGKDAPSLLEIVSSPCIVRFDIRDRRRRTIFELVMCFLVPTLFVALHYTVQRRRYHIVKNIEHQATPVIFLVYVPPLACAAAMLVYADVLLRHFIRRRLTFSSHLQQRSSTLVTIMLGSALTTPATSRLTSPSRCARGPIGTTGTRIGIVLTVWLVTPVTGLVFFAFCGWGAEVKKEYGKGHKHIPTGVRTWRQPG
ncbi:STE3-domain-containing protein [Hymenopellis radicata]|nr:STE3-domain-containing protein [Hymenopellis radicata]